MGFYGNYYKINAGEGLVVNEKGQSIDIKLEPYITNSISKKLIVDSIGNDIDNDNGIENVYTQGFQQFDNICMYGSSKGNSAEADEIIKIGDCVLVLTDIDLTNYGNSSHYTEFHNLENNILKKDTVLICIDIINKESVSKGWYFSNIENINLTPDIQKIFWNQDQNKQIHFYDEEYENSEFIENNSIIVDSQKQTIAIQKDGEEIVLGQGLPLEKADGKNSIQSSDSDNEILADGSFGFGKGLKNTEQNRNQFIRGTYNEIDEEGKYIDMVGNGQDEEHRSNAYALDKEGNAYFSGEVYVKNKEGQEPIKLQNFEVESQQNFVTVSNNGQDGVEITDIGDYYVTISTQFPDKVYCNDGITNNKIGWPYLEQFEVTGGVEVTNNQNGSLTINGTTLDNINIIFHSWEYPNKYNGNESYYQIMVDNLPNGIVPYNVKQDDVSIDDTNCRLVYDDKNKKLIIQIDISNLNGKVTFTNTILYPWVSEEMADQASIQKDGWQTPIGTQYNAAGQIKIKPTKQDALLFKTLNPKNNLTISYYKNMNSILNVFPNTFNQDNQIALKRDCQKVYGYEVDEDKQLIKNKKLFLQPYFQLINSGSAEDNYEILEGVNTWNMENKYTYFMTSFHPFYNEQNGYIHEDISYVFDQFTIYKLDHEHRAIELVADLKNKSFNLTNENNESEILSIKPSINYEVQIEGKKYTNFKIDGIFAVDNKYAYIILHKINPASQNSNKETIDYGYLIKYNFTNQEYNFKQIDKKYLYYTNGYYYFDNGNTTYTRVYQNDNYIIFFNQGFQIKPLLIDKSNLKIYNFGATKHYDPTEIFNDQFILLQNNQFIYNFYSTGYERAILSWGEITINDKSEFVISWLINEAFNLKFTIMNTSYIDRIKMYSYGNNIDRYIFIRVHANSKRYVSVIKESDFALDEPITSDKWDGKSFALDPYITIQHYTNDTDIAYLNGSKNYFSLKENKFFYQNELLDFYNGEFLAQQNNSILPNYSLIPYSCLNENTIHVVKNDGKLYKVNFEAKNYTVVSWRGEEQWP